jgi:hypothetical protein
MSDHNEAAKLYDGSSIMKHDSVSGGKDLSEVYAEGAQVGTKFGDFEG